MDASLVAKIPPGGDPMIESSPRKNGFLPFAGKIVLLAYFSLSSFVRVIAAILLFTPFLGLFDTMSHFKMANTEFNHDEQGPNSIEKIST